MSTAEIITSCIGLLIVCVVFGLIGILITGLLWHMIRNDLDFEEQEDNDTTTNDTQR